MSILFIFNIKINFKHIHIDTQLKYFNNKTILQRMKDLICLTIIPGQE